MPVLIGLAIGLLVGVAYVFSKEPSVRRTLASSVLLGIVVGVLVELAREPLFASIFAGVATIFLVEFIRWVMKSYAKRK